MKSSERTIKPIFIDLDGVICNFVAGAAAHFGTTEAQLLEKWSPGEYSVHGALGLDSEDEFWRSLERSAASDSWWDALEPYPYAAELVKMAATAGEAFFLTSPSSQPGSASGKLRWIKRHFPEMRRHFILTPKKHLLAAPGRVLIDDWDKHTDHWKIAGGTAILFPRIWNSAHAKRGNPVAVVAEALRRAAE